METFHLANEKKGQGDSISLQGYAHHVLGHASGHTAENPAHDENVNAASYCTNLRELRQAICHK